MKITILNRQTKDIRRVPLAFDWVGFVSAFIFGIPHFLRGMNTHGWIIIGLNVASLLTYIVPLDEDAMAAMTLAETLVFIGVAIAFGIKGSEQYAKSLLVKGYEFENPSGELAQAAMQKWSIAN